MLCAVPYGQPLDPRFGSVNEFRTDAGSHYTGLQASATKQWRDLTVRGNYTYSHCLDEVSNGGLLPFSSLGILSPLPGNLRKEYGNCDYDVRHNLSAFGIYTDTVSFQPRTTGSRARGMAVFGDRVPAQRIAVQRGERPVRGE